MAKKHLIIAGHGPRKNGTFDPGASGLIKQGEHKFISQKFFKSMKKYATKDFIFISEYNVFDRGNVVALARSYGLDTTVTELHFDASSSKSASGGHVIIYSQFEPDAMDLRIRDAIDKMVGVRYSHRGHKGISGRSNLGNVNRTASGDRRGSVNYRLVELGFGTNAKDVDVMTNKTDQYAKELVKAILNTSKVESNETKPAKPKPKQSSEQVARAISKGLGGWGNNPERARKLKAAGYNPDAIQRRVNDILKESTPTVSVPKKKSSEEVAQEIAKGTGGWGNNPDRAAKLRRQGYDASSIQNRVNEILMGKTSKPKGLTSSQINSYARQVLKGIDDNGKRIPNGRPARAKHFGISANDMDRVQEKVNRSL